MLRCELNFPFPPLFPSLALSTPTNASHIYLSSRPCSHVCRWSGLKTSAKGPQAADAHFLPLNPCPGGQVLLLVNTNNGKGHPGLLVHSTRWSRTEPQGGQQDSLQGSPRVALGRSMVSPKSASSSYLPSPAPLKLKQLSRSYARRRSGLPARSISR